ncbi:MAG: class I SAM-dependent methyltransferase [Arenicellales bacterium]
MNKKSVTEYPNAPDIESSTWDYATRFAGPVGEWLLRQQIEATREILSHRWPNQSGLSVLDVGGGHGQNIDVIGELGHELTIIGSNEDCAEVIKVSLNNGKVRFDTASLLSLPYDDDSFDIVICYRILSHMESWQELIQELTRVSRHLVLVDYPSKRSVNIVADLLFTIKRRIEKNTRRYGCFSDNEIDDVFIRNGFTRTNRRRQFFFPMAVYRLVGSVRFATLAAWIFRTSGLTRVFGSPVISAYRPD